MATKTTVPGEALEGSEKKRGRVPKRHSAVLARGMDRLERLRINIGCKERN